MLNYFEMLTLKLPLSWERWEFKKCIDFLDSSWYFPDLSTYACQMWSLSTVVSKKKGEGEYRYRQRDTAALVETYMTDVEQLVSIIVTYRLCLGVPCWTLPAGTPSVRRPRSRPVWSGSSDPAAPATGGRWPLLVSRGAWSSLGRHQLRRCQAWNDKTTTDIVLAQQTTIAFGSFHVKQQMFDQFFMQPTIDSFEICRNSRNWLETS